MNESKVGYSYEIVVDQATLPCCNSFDQVPRVLHGIVCDCQKQRLFLYQHHSAEFPCIPAPSATSDHLTSTNGDLVVGFEAVLPIMALDVVWRSNRCIVRSYTLYVELKVGAVKLYTFRHRCAHRPY